MADPDERIRELEAVVEKQAERIAQLEAMVEKLRELLERNSSNSSMPPSTDRGKNPKRNAKKGKKRGKRGAKKGRKRSAAARCGPSHNAGRLSQDRYTGDAGSSGDRWVQDRISNSMKQSHRFYMTIERSGTLNSDLCSCLIGRRWDSTMALFDDVCDCLDSAGAVKFRVGGFGQLEWPVDAATDLPVMLGQLPDICEIVAAGNEVGELDFYEQGIERRVKLEPLRNGYNVGCVSGTSWSPNPSVFWESREEISAMLRDVRDGFLSILSKAAPWISSHPLVHAWSARCAKLQE